MNSPMPPRAPARAVRLALTACVCTVAATCALLLAPPPADAASGGIGTGDNSRPSGRYHDAKLSHGRAIAPRSAPRRVKRAIRYANRIRHTRYEWGGGHGSFRDNGYDCSGAVSYMLHGARMLGAPMASGALERWGRRGKGRWITVYANAGHTYAMVAGLRWDTSGGPGPRWHRGMRSGGGYRVRHYKGF